MPDEAKSQNPPYYQELLADLPLYKRLSLPGNKTSVFNYVNTLRYYNGHIDLFCPNCIMQSVFLGNVYETNTTYNNATHQSEVLPKKIVNLYTQAPPESFTLTFSCSREKKHRIRFHFRFWEEEFEEYLLMKVGQFPSLADLALADTRKYAKVLGQERSREFTKAIGLVAHGVGAGSLVYLRRIFESLIVDASARASEVPGFDPEPLKGMKVADKVAALKDHLPPFLVENRTPLYGILSKGVHEMSEDESANAFPFLRSCIELILDQEIERRERAAKEANARKALAALGQQAS